MPDGPEARERSEMLRQLGASVSDLRRDLASLKAEVHSIRTRMDAVENPPRRSWAAIAKEQMWLLAPSLAVIGFVWTLGYDNLVSRARVDMGIEQLERDMIGYRQEAAEEQDGLSRKIDAIAEGQTAVRADLAETRRDIASSLGRDKPIRVLRGSASEPVYEDEDRIDIFMELARNPGFEGCILESGLILLEPQGRSAAPVLNLEGQRRIGLAPAEIELSVEVPPGLLRPGLMRVLREAFYDCDGRTVSTLDLITETRVRALGDRAALDAPSPVAPRGGE